MNLEEMLRRERDRVAPNPLAGRTDQLVSRVRGRRRARAAVQSVVGLSTVALLATVVWQLFLPQLAVAPAELVPVPTHSTEVRIIDDVPRGTPVEAGRYAFPVHDARSPAPALPVVPVMSVPDGYTSLEVGGGIFAGDLELSDSTDGRGLWTWQIDTVYAHPCDTALREVEVGPTVADLATALATQPLRAGTAPVAVTVAGYPGLYVELSVPDDVEPDDCPTGRFNSWPGRWQQGPGQVDMIWIVDVDGQRIVFDAPYGPGTSPADVQELKAMVTDATFMPSESLTSFPVSTDPAR